VLTDFIEAVRVRLNVDASFWLTGAYQLGSITSTERYVWVPRRDRIGGAGLSSAFAKRLPRPLLTRVAGVDCHVLGPDLNTTETRAHNVIAAAHELWKGSIDFDGLSWPEEMINERGVVCVVHFGVHIPITAVALEQVQAGQATAIECDDTPPATPDRWVECCEETDP
jgi:hypothetical protein